MELPTYTNIWKIEKRLYKLYDFRLPMPLPIGQVTAFLAVAVPYMLILSLIGMPFSHTWLWLYVLPPGVIAWLVTRPVLEGKRLPELILSQLRYLTEPRTWCRMAPLAEKDEIAVAARVWRGPAVTARPVFPARTADRGAPVRGAAVRGAAVRDAAVRDVEARAGAVASEAVPSESAQSEAAAASVATPGESVRVQPGVQMRPAWPSRPAMAGVASSPTPESTAPDGTAPDGTAPGAQDFTECASQVPGGPVPVAVGRGGLAPTRAQDGSDSAASGSPASGSPAPVSPASVSVAVGQDGLAPTRAQDGSESAPQASPELMPPTSVSRSNGRDEVTLAPAQEASASHVLADSALASPAQANGQSRAESKPPAVSTSSDAPESPAAPVSPAVKRAGPPVAATPGQSSGVPRGRRPVLTVQTSGTDGGQLTVERALRTSPGSRPGGFHDRVVLVPGGHRPGKPDHLQRDQSRARLPLPGPARIVVLGCTAGAGQTITTLLTGQLLASLRGEAVAVLDIQPGPGSLTERARQIPRLLPGSRDTAGPAARRNGSGRERGLQVVTAHSSADQSQDAGLLIDAVVARYPLALVDPAAVHVPRALNVADQLVLVVPASPEAAAALAMTLEWLDANDHTLLARTAVTVLNGVSNQTSQYVDKAAAVAIGRCRAVVRAPWDARMAGGGALSPQAVHAYTAIAGVLVSGLADPALSASAASQPGVIR